MELTPEAEQFAVTLTSEMQIGSHRADIVLFEAARAYAAIDERPTAETSDVIAVAPLVLRRRKSMLASFEEEVQREDTEIKDAIKRVAGSTATPATSPRVKRTAKSRRQKVATG